MEQRKFGGGASFGVCAVRRASERRLCWRERQHFCGESGSFAVESGCNAAARGEMPREIITLQLGQCGNQSERTSGPSTSQGFLGSTGSHCGILNSICPSQNRSSPKGGTCLTQYPVAQPQGALLCPVADEKEMATHSSILAWRIPRTVEPGRLQPVGWQSQT